MVSNGWAIWFLALYSKLIVGHHNSNSHFNAFVFTCCYLSFSVCSQVDAQVYAPCYRYIGRYTISGVWCLGGIGNNTVGKRYDSTFIPCCLCWILPFIWHSLFSCYEYPL